MRPRPICRVTSGVGGHAPVPLRHPADAVADGLWTQANGADSETFDRNTCSVTNDG